MNDYVKYSGLAFQMMAILGLGVWGGMKIDSLMGNDFPVFLIVCALLAFAAAIVIIIKSLPD